MSTIASVATSAGVSALMSGIVVLYNRSQVIALEAKIDNLKTVLKQTTTLVVNLTDDNTRLTKKVADIDGASTFKEQQGRHTKTLTAHDNRINDLEVHIQIVMKSMLELLPPDTLNKNEQRILSRKIVASSKTKQSKKTKKSKKKKKEESSGSGDESSDKSSSSESSSSAESDISESSEDKKKKKSKKKSSKKGKKSKSRSGGIGDDTVAMVKNALEDS